MYLLSDVLFNAATPGVVGASQFRRQIEPQLPEVFSFLSHRLRGCTGRMSAQQFSLRVDALLAAWEKHSLFPMELLVSLRVRFLDTAPPAPSPAATAAGGGGSGLCAQDSNSLDID
jgi:hypothetical protein